MQAMLRLVLACRPAGSGSFLNETILICICLFQARFFRKMVPILSDLALLSWRDVKWSVGGKDTGDRR
jgi:hypothetical protein